MSGHVLTPSREKMAGRVVHAFASITDDAIRDVGHTAYFPNRLKISQLDDAEYFNLEEKYSFGSEQRDARTSSTWGWLGSMGGA